MDNNNVWRRLLALTEHENKAVRVAYNLAFTALVLLVAALLTELLYQMNVEEQGLSALYYLAVLIISYITPGYSYGIAGALISTLAADYFVMDPRYGFSFTRSSPITLVAMLAVTFLTSTLAIQMKNENKNTRERELRARQMSENSRLLLAARSEGAIVDIALENLSARFHTPVIYYRADPTQAGMEAVRLPAGEVPDQEFLGPEEWRRVHNIFLSGREESPDLSGEKRRSILYVPALSKEGVMGVFGIRHLRADSEAVLSYTRLILSQISLALELQRLSDGQSRMVIENEKEKMRSTLLRSISHDLRTPLTSITGASNAILERPDMDEQTRTGLLRDIVENADWLIRVVENILTITKISEETMTVKKTPEAAEEVVAQAVAIARKRFPDCLIHVRIPDELLLVPMDATLIQQVLINLIENAAKNSSEREMILVDLQRQKDWARFEVADNGHGIPAHMLDSLFESYTPQRDQSADTARGLGLGLSICRTIIHAHGGYIEGYNRESGGATFHFLLPLEEGRGEHAEPAEHSAD